MSLFFFDVFCFARRIEKDRTYFISRLGCLVGKLEKPIISCRCRIRGVRVLGVYLGRLVLI